MKCTSTPKKTNALYHQQYDQLLDAMTIFPTRIQAKIADSRLLHTQVPTFSGNKDRFNELELLLRNQLQPFRKKLKE